MLALPWRTAFQADRKVAPPGQISTGSASAASTPSMTIMLAQ